MPREPISIATNDGACPTSVFTPEGVGPWPAAIFYMDGLGIRPTLFEMAQRLADFGYVVLLPDLFYRAGPYAPMDPKAIFAQGNFRAVVGPLMDTTDFQKAAEDTGAFLAHLDKRSDVASKQIGVTGYCMGGGMALSAAGTFPERIAAAASFHGGRLATDQPGSPHLLAPRLQAEVYVASADNDPSCPPDMIERLDVALTQAGVVHRCETYAGTKHGWTMPDFPVYDDAAAERHWRELIALFARNLEIA
ncbi:MAG TPA: dienelactone hydrolase family protein [Xanthomonadaceae bacterium]|jgi:carboxymethylenebutenolidase